MRRVVKHGDPLSPWLFKIVLDKLLAELLSSLGVFLKGNGNCDGFL